MNNNNEKSNPPWKKRGEELNLLWDCLDLGIYDKNNYSSITDMLNRIAYLTEEILKDKIPLHLYCKKNLQDQLPKNKLQHSKQLQQIERMFFHKKWDTINKNTYLTYKTPQNTMHLFNPKALIILDNLQLDDTLKLTASLGNKFIHSQRISTQQINQFNTTINKIENNIEPHNLTNLKELKITKYLMNLDNPTRLLKLNEEYNNTTALLRRCLHSTNLYLNNHKDILITQADKGNVTVILKKTTYLDKLTMHINEGIEKGTYSKPRNKNIVLNHLETSAKMIWHLYSNWKRHNNSNHIKKLKQDHPRLIPPIYGTIKIHKEDLPIRPIVADINNTINPIQEDIIPILKLYTQHYDFIIKNTEEMIQHLNILTTNNPDICNTEQRIYSIDFESMYTNVDLDIFFQIIKRDFAKYKIEELHNISLIDLTSILLICLKDFAYIAAPEINEEEQTIYKQLKGIPMGGKLSYIISEIVTAEGIHNTLKTLEENSIKP